MSRVLKFRIWDKANKEYMILGAIGLDARNGDVIDYYNEARRLGGPEEYDVEQFTGLKDKNGKEIYEGDIVNLAYYEKPHDKKRWNKVYPHKGGKDINVVSFEDGYFKFHQEDKDGYGSELAFSDYGEWESRDCEYKYEAEVIGNIHENKELWSESV